MSSCCITIDTSHAYAILKGSAASANLTSLVEFLLENSIMFPLLMLLAISMMHSTCDGPSLFLLKESPENTRISNDSKSNFFYLSPSFGCFFKCFVNELMGFRSFFCHVSFVTYERIFTAARSFGLVCNTHARLCCVVRILSKYGYSLKILMLEMWSVCSKKNPSGVAVILNPTKRVSGYSFSFHSN